MRYAIGTAQPQCGHGCYIAPGAAIIGDVVLGENVSIWFNAVLRGDNDRIRVGDGSNVQECAVLHVDDGVPLSIGKRVTIGHKAMIHGCTIGDGSLIGMNAVVLNHAVIGKHCLIGANALITEGMEIPDRSLVLGSPAKTVRPLPESAMQDLERAAQNYIDKIPLYRESLRPLAD